MKLFDELDALTREPFRLAKEEIDTKLAANCGISVDELRPWHYHDPFFQEPPAVFAARPRRALMRRPTSSSSAATSTPASACRSTTCWLAATSTKSPARARTPSASTSTAMGDVRVLGNIVPNEYWAGTMLHELGHSVYSSQEHPARLSLTSSEPRPTSSRPRGSPCSSSGSRRTRTGWRGWA